MVVTYNNADNGLSSICLPWGRPSQPAPWATAKTRFGIQTKSGVGRVWSCRSNGTHRVAGWEGPGAFESAMVRATPFERVVTNKDGGVCVCVCVDGVERPSSTWSSCGVLVVWICGGLRPYKGDCPLQLKPTGRMWYGWQCMGASYGGTLVRIPAGSP